jgi:hypothetical protein
MKFTRFSAEKYFLSGGGTLLPWQKGGGAGLFARLLHARKCRSRYLPRHFLARREISGEKKREAITPPALGMLVYIKPAA